MSSHADKWLRRANIARQLELTASFQATRLDGVSSDYVEDAEWFGGWYSRMANEAMQRQNLEALVEQQAKGGGSQ